MKGRLQPGGEISRHVDLIEAASALYADILATALREKTDQARAITFAEIHGMAARSSSGS
jgi:hypothetical protein